MYQKNVTANVRDYFLEYTCTHFSLECVQNESCDVNDQLFMHLNIYFKERSCITLCNLNFCNFLVHYI